MVWVDAEATQQYFSSGHSEQPHKGFVKNKVTCDHFLSENDNSQQQTDCLSLHGPVLYLQELCF